MALGGGAVDWDQTDPADTKNLGLGAGDIRSLKTNLQGGLDSEHIWPTSTGTAGAHRLGSARVFVGTASQMSSVDTDGRLGYVPASRNLWYLSASTATIITSPADNQSYVSSRLVHTGATFTWPNRMALQSGFTVSVAGSRTTVGFGTTYVIPPIVVVSPLGAIVAGDMVTASVATSGTTNFAFQVAYFSNSSATLLASVQVNWISSGTLIT